MRTSANDIRKASVIHWIARILCLTAIIFISLFALDAFSPDLTVIQQLGAFFVHMIPSFILIVLLFLAWKKELAGGLVFILIGLGFSPLVFTPVSY